MPACLSNARYKSSKISLYHGNERSRNRGRENRFSLAVKVVSSGIPHKTEAGGIELGIKDVHDLKASIERIKQRVLKNSKIQKLMGFLYNAWKPASLKSWLALELMK